MPAAISACGTAPVASTTQRRAHLVRLRRRLSGARRPRVRWPSSSGASKRTGACNARAGAHARRGTGCRRARVRGSTASRPGTSTRPPRGPMQATCAPAAPAPSPRRSTPSRRSAACASGIRPSPQTLSRGKACWSTSTECNAGARQLSARRRCRPGRRRRRARRRIGQGGRSDVSWHRERAAIVGSRRIDRRWPVGRALIADQGATRRRRSRRSPPEASHDDLQPSQLAGPDARCSKPTAAHCASTNSTAAWRRTRAARRAPTMPASAAAGRRRRAAARLPTARSISRCAIGNVDELGAGQPAR